MEAEEEHGGALRRGCAGVFSQAFVIEEDTTRFLESGGWWYALFDYEAAAALRLRECDSYSRSQGAYLGVTLILQYSDKDHTRARSVCVRLPP